jgi:hypothetical protein
MACPPSPSVQRRNAGNHSVEICAEVNGELLALYDFCVDRPVNRTLLVLKLDHRGDFLIGLSASGITAIYISE